MDRTETARLNRPSRTRTTLTVRWRRTVRGAFSHGARAAAGRPSVRPVDDFEAARETPYNVRSTISGGAHARYRSALCYQCRRCCCCARPVPDTLAFSVVIRKLRHVLLFDSPRRFNRTRSLKQVNMFSNAKPRAFFSFFPRSDSLRVQPELCREAVTIIGQSNSLAYGQNVRQTFT